MTGSGGSDLSGFNGEGGSVAASYSDVCSGGAPLIGAGNICAAPLLAGASAGDVHETSASPTIDAGSNTLVPGDLATDAFGEPRIQAARSYTPACTPGAIVASRFYPATVDIGASEFGPVALPAIAIACVGGKTSAPPVPAPPGLTHFVRLKTGATGAALTLSCSSTDGLGCSGTIFITTDELLHGKKIVGVGLEGHSKVSVRLAQVPFSLAPGATATFQVKLNSTGRSLLRRFHAISAFVLANEASPTSTPFIFLFHTARFEGPKPKKKHNSRHARHSGHH